MPPKVSHEGPALAARVSAPLNVARGTAHRWVLDAERDAAKKEAAQHERDEIIKLLDEAAPRIEKLFYEPAGGARRTRVAKRVGDAELQGENNVKSKKLEAGARPCARDVDGTSGREGGHAPGA